MYGKGMLVFNGFGQSDAMWNLRTNNTILSIFKKIYDCEELVTSLDGFSVFVSHDQKSKSWLHVDQNPKNSIYSIQGAYNFLPVKNESDAGFVVVPKSHIEYNPTVKHKKDWIVCEPQPVDKSVKPPIPQIVHFGIQKLNHANEGMKKQPRALNRLTCYITYLPKETRTEK